MSDTVKLIIEIPKNVYAECQGDIYFPDTGGELFNAVKNATPLDDVKTEIDDARNLYLNLVGDSGYCNGLNKALKILDNIGKADMRGKADETN